jgi:hypothetical protein
MVCFQTKNPNLGKFWMDWDRKMLIYFMTVWNILWRVGILYDHLVHFVFILYIFSDFGIMCGDKSGNPVWDRSDPIKVEWTVLLLRITGIQESANT